MSLVDAGDGEVLVAGELDAATGHVLACRLEATPPVRVLHLADVTFIDAHGLRVLLRALDGSTGEGRVRVRAPSRPVLRLGAIAGLDGDHPLYHGIDPATLQSGEHDPRR